MKGFGLGTVILVEDTLVILSDRGELTLAKPNHFKFENWQAFKFCQASKTGLRPPMPTAGCIVGAVKGIGSVFRWGISQLVETRNLDEDALISLRYPATRNPLFLWGERPDNTSLPIRLLSAVLVQTAPFPFSCNK